MRGDGGDSPEGEYERYRAAVLGMLAKRFPRLDADERLSIYHDAWTRVLAKRACGERFESLRAYLMATTGAEALHTLSRAKIPTPIGPDDPRLAALADGAPPLDEQVVTRDQARIARNLLDSLDERQRDVLKLRWDLQLTGAEVRAALGLTERQYRRLAEEGATALAQRVEEHQSGQWSRRTRSLLVACLVEVTGDGKRRVGIASRRQREEAQRLLESDPHVAALYAEVRRSARGAAALLPLPAFVAESNGGLLLARVSELASDALGLLVRPIETAKQQATSLYIRIGDPALLASGPRPGTAVVAVAGALALGGGTYGAYQAVSTTPSRPTPAAAAQTVIPTPRPTPPLQKPTPSRPSNKPVPRPKPPAPPEPQPPTAAYHPTQAQAPLPTPPTQPPPNPPQTTEFGFED
jgi:DNA-directed RNA polymerase specialized sigma24 family protein